MWHKLHHFGWGLAGRGWTDTGGGTGVLGGGQELLPAGSASSVGPRRIRGGVRQPEEQATLLSAVLEEEPLAVADTRDRHKRRRDVPGEEGRRRQVEDTAWATRSRKGMLCPRAGEPLRGLQRTYCPRWARSAPRAPPPRAGTAGRAGTASRAGACRWPPRAARRSAVELAARQPLMHTRSERRCGETRLRRPHPALLIPHTPAGGRPWPSFGELGAAARVGRSRSRRPRDTSTDGSARRGSLLPRIDREEGALPGAKPKFVFLAIHTCDLEFPRLKPAVEQHC